jgi:hypothetical protein
LKNPAHVAGFFWAGSGCDFRQGSDFSDPVSGVCPMSTGHVLAQPVFASERGPDESYEGATPVAGRREKPDRGPTAAAAGSLQP